MAMALHFATRNRVPLPRAPPCYTIPFMGMKSILLNKQGRIRWRVILPLLAIAFLTWNYWPRSAADRKSVV
mgnify:CR=1 FL=1